MRGRTLPRALARARSKTRAGRAAAAALAAVATVALLPSGAAADTLRPLPVPVVTVYPGDTISPGMLVEKPFSAASPWIGSMVDSAATAVGRVARRTLPPGSPIPVDALRQPHIVARGQAVTIVYSEGGLSISGTGMALQSAAKGDAIQVRNADSGRTIQATVIDDRTVAVGAR